MVAVGDKLGGRYFVTKVDAKLAPGGFLEVRDAQSNVFHAQMLGAKPMAPTEISSLAREVASVSPMPSLYLPEEVTQDPAGVPYAVFSRAPAELLADDLRLYESGGSKQRRAQTFRALTGAFATLAEELARAGGARSTHGAIGVQHVGATGRDGTLRLELRGFGVDAVTRIQAKQERPPPRADAAALFLTLHDLLSRTQSLPEGPPLVKWNLVHTCARAGDHPALQNTASVGRFLREMLVEIEAVRDSAPRASSASVEPAAPSAPKAPSPAKDSGTPAKAPAAPKARFDLRAWVEDNRRAAIGGAVGVALLVVAGVASSMMEDTPAAPTAPPPTTPTARPTAAEEPLPACNGESLQAPAAADLPPDGVAFGAACVDGSLRLFAAGASNLAHAARSARRGARFEEASTRSIGGASSGPDLFPADGAVPAEWPEGRRTEVDGALWAGGGPWVAWREAFRFHVAPLRAGGGAGLEGEFFALWRGVWMLTANDRSAWLAATVQAHGAETFALRLSASTPPEQPRQFSLGAGAVVASIPGDAATLLLQKTTGQRHEFTCITVNTSVLPVLATAAPPPADAPPGWESVATVPDVALQRTPAFTLEGPRVTVLSTGVGRAGEARSFLVTEGDAGPVTLVTFPAQGAPSATRLTARGVGVGLGLNGRNEPVAVVAEGATTALYTRPAGENPTRELVPLRGIARARVVSCGDEPWLAFTAGAPTPRVAAVPLACVSRRALAR